MIVYLAGNFDLLIYPHKEKELLETHLNTGLHYNRLISFFESHRINGILNLKKEKDNEEYNRNSGIVGKSETFTTGNSE